MHLDNCLKRLGDGADYEYTEMLKQTDTLNYTTTIADHIVKSEKGPRVGLIVTKGFEETLYATSNRTFPKGRFVPEELIAGITEEVDPSGNIVKGIDRTEVYALTKSLMELGAQVVAICLRNSYYNPKNEQSVMTIIDKEISKHYLGGVITLCSNEVSTNQDDFVRMCTTVLNQFVNRDASRLLKIFESRVKHSGLASRLRVCSAALGGVKRMAKTRAINTFSGSEIAGLNGALFMSDKLGNKNIILVDIGDDATTVGIIRNGVYEFELTPDIAGLTVDVPRPAIKTLNAGGYSVASVDRRGMLVLETENIGQSGTEPTVTDAKIVLGYDLAADYSDSKSEDQAHKVIKDRIAGKLESTKEEAALRIIETLEGVISDGVKEVLSGQGCDAKEFDIYVVGGAGATHCCSLAKRVGARRAVIFPFGSVFSAFGVTTMDIVYEYRIPVSEKDDFNEVLESIKGAATKDLKYEGVTEKNLTYTYGFVLKDESGTEMLVQVGSEDLRTEAEKISSANHEITAVMIKVSAMTTKPALGEKEKQASKPAENGKRRVYFSDGVEDAKVYTYPNIGVGNRVEGPAVVELDGSTLVIPKGCELVIDNYRNGIIQHEC